MLIKYRPVRMTVLYRAFNFVSFNQKNMYQSSLLLCFLPSFILTSSHSEKPNKVVHGGYSGTEQHGFPVITAETNNERSFWHHSLGVPATCGRRVITKKSLPSEKGLNLVLSEIDTHSGYRFAFPFHSCSTKTTIHGLQIKLVQVMESQLSYFES